MSKIKCFFLEDTGKVTGFEKIFDDNGKFLGETQDRIYRRADTGEEIVGLANAPIGAMWFADWYGKRWNPQLEFSLIVKTPGGDWHVDQQSSNCTLPEDRFQHKHHCWIIRGTIPNLTVGKSGVTCGAGAGSIQIGNYHGFLIEGFLTDC